MKIGAAFVIAVLVLTGWTPTRQQRLEAAVTAATEIAEACRRRRLDGHLPSFSASVDCSNQRMRAAIASTEYPHMDLIDRWLSYRVAIAARADRDNLSASQAGELMAAMTRRITTESMHAVHPTCRYDNYLSPMQVARRSRLLEAVPNLPLTVG